MHIRTAARRQTRFHRQFAVQFISFVVAAHGIITLASILLAQIAIHRGTRVTSVDFDVPLIAGIFLLYLSMLLRRQKRTAWLVALATYALYLVLGLAGWLSPVHVREATMLEVIKSVALPIAVLAMLIVYRNEFVVRSDVRGFRDALRFSLVVLLVAFLYGVAGMLLMDMHDFHQEMSYPTAVHYTLDQFNATTDHPLHPYTQRARLFLDSLSLVSSLALVYVAVALFQPLRLRLVDQGGNRALMAQLMASNGAKSEDFFKLWPHDKQYFFDQEHKSGLAFHVHRGVALCLGDPAGQKREFGRLMNEFDTLCHLNDWLPALIHIQDTHWRLYEKQGFSLQKIGQEAVLDIGHFQAEVARNKYFRHIRNKFTKQDYRCELLEPPHHQAVLDRLQAISEDWLQADGRIERKFVMGYYSHAYMQECQIMVVRDAAGTIQAFINLVPADFDREEATFDMLRHTKSSPGNINDFLLVNVIEQLESAGYKYLNLGLCPLVGLESGDKEANKLIDGFLRFAYANGDRFYSFSGLHRFKAKYEPEWRNRYIAYQNGIPGFTRTMTALMQTVRVKT